MKKLTYALAMLLAGAAQAATYPLPDPAISVNPNYSNTTTIVTIAGVTYRGPSQFYYVSECARPDGPTYHCNVMAESGVVLVAAGGQTITVDLTVQFAGILIRSGHNYWRTSQLVLNGDVTTP